MPARILYVGQEVKIQTAANASNATRYLPVQSASCEVTKPLEDILSFGRLGSLARVQTSVSTCKADIKTYIPYATGTGTITNASRGNLLDPLFISALTGEALAGYNAVISVSPNGFIMSGILTSLNIDLSNGSFATADMSFAGVGEPFIASAPTGVSFSEQTNMPSSFSPIFSSLVSGQTESGCANSFKFSLDLPSETISCLGGNVTGSQGQVQGDFLQVSKPPYKSTVSVEGTSVDAPISGSNEYIVGRLGITLPQGQVTSRSFNNAVGNAGGNYSYTIEDVSAVFRDVAVNY
jgi:hypothetical protein